MNTKFSLIGKSVHNQKEDRALEAKNLIKKNLIGPKGLEEEAPSEEARQADFVCWS